MSHPYYSGAGLVAVVQGPPVPDLEDIEGSVLTSGLRIKSPMKTLREWVEEARKKVEATAPTQATRAALALAPAAAAMPITALAEKRCPSGWQMWDIRLKLPPPWKTDPKKYIRLGGTNCYRPRERVPVMIPMPGVPAMARRPAFPGVATPNVVKQWFCEQYCKPSCGIGWEPKRVAPAAAAAPAAAPRRRARPRGPRIRAIPKAVVPTRVRGLDVSGPVLSSNQQDPFCGQCATFCRPEVAAPAPAAAVPRRRRPRPRGPRVRPLPAAPAVPGRVRGNLEEERGGFAKALPWVIGVGGLLWLLSRKKR